MTLETRKKLEEAITLLKEVEQEIAEGVEQRLGGEGGVPLMALSIELGAIGVVNKTLEEL